MSWENGDNNSPWGKKPSNSGQKPRISEDDFDKIIKDSQEKIKKLFTGRRSNSGNNGSGNNGGGEKFVLALPILLGAIVLLWLSTGFYTVDTKEEAIVMRFGKHVATTQAGLNYHLPTPIESVIKLPAKQRNKLKVEYERESLEGGLERVSAGNKEMLMLTGDENIVDVGIEIQWQIKEGQGYKYIFNTKDAEKTLRDSAESAMREIIGTTPLNDILSEKREAIEIKTKDLLQSILDSYDIGVSVEKVNMLEGVPPSNKIEVEESALKEDGSLESNKVTTTVQDAFKDVQAAKTDRESAINTAKAYANEVVPQARGEAERLILDARGYKEQVVAKSQGEAGRFNSIYDEYKIAKDVTKKRIYIETMEKVMTGVDKIYLDSESGVLPYLPVNDIKKKN